MKYTRLPENEKERLKVLQNAKTFDIIYEAHFERITELASSICDTNIAFVTLIDKDNQWYRSNKIFSAEEIAIENEFYKRTVMNTEFLEILNVIDDVRLSTNSSHQYIKIVYYAGIPLIDPEGKIIGTLSVFDTKARKELTGKQIRLLELLSIEVVSLVNQINNKKELSHFLKLYKISPDLICETDAQGILQRINPAFKSTLGWSEEDLVGNSLYNFLHPYDLQSTSDEFKRLNSGKNAVSFTGRFKTKKGEYKTLQWSATIETDAYKVLAIARDVTKDKNIQQKISNSENKLKSFI